MALELNKELLDELYPARLAVTPEGLIEAAGPSLVRHLGEGLVGRKFLDAFKFERPRIHDVAELIGCSVLLFVVTLHSFSLLSRQSLLGP